MKLRLLLAALAIVGAQAATAATLQDIYQQALRSDPQLKAAHAVFNADREVEQQSLSALLPGINLSADTSYTTISPSGIRDGNSYGYSLDWRQPVFRAEEWFNLQSSKTQVRRAEVELSSQQQLLIQRAVEAYLDVLLAQTSFETTESVEAAVKRRLDQVRAQFDVGLIAITDVEEARASYDEARVARIVAEGRLDTSFESVDRLTGQYWTQLDPLSSAFPVSTLTPAEFQPWVDKALAENLQLQLAALDVSTAEQLREASRARHLPSIDLVAGYGRDQGARSLDPSGDSQNTGSIGLSLNLPLYLGGRTTSQLRESGYRWDASIQLREDTRREVVQATRSLHRDLMTDVESVAARKQSIVSSETALEATATGYSVGTRNIVDVLQAERTLYTAIEAYQVARYLYIRHLVQFKVAVGTLSPDDINQLDRWLVKPGVEAPLYQKREADTQGNG